MDFIERWFGISPDGGTGALEAFYLVSTLALLSVLAARAFWSKRSAASRPERP